MTEKIIKIENVHDFKLAEGDTKSYWEKYDGYKITTNSRELYLLIDNGQSCCEDWGYFESNDEDFIYYENSELLNVSVVDTALNKEYLVDGISESDAMFVNLETSKGVLQLAVYNSHNGYYGHTVLFKQNDKWEESTL